MAGYIDFHTHVFPDQIASVAIEALEKKGNVKAYLNGTVTDLLASMDRAGIDCSVVCSIATRPQQFKPILDWSKSICSERIVPLPSIHPADPDRIAQLELIQDGGFIGLKMHPYYQDFYLSEDKIEMGLVPQRLRGENATFDVKIGRKTIVEEGFIDVIGKTHPVVNIDIRQLLVQPVGIEGISRRTCSRKRFDHI